VTMQDNWWASAPVVGATPAPVAQPRPQQQTAPRPRPAAPIAAAPALNELGITNAQERDALMDQGYTAAQADAFLAQNSAAMPAPSAPIVQEAPSDAWWSEAPVEGQSSTGFELPEGVIDWNTLTDEQRRGLTRGTRIMLPQREGETFRQVGTLAADMNAPMREDLPGDVIQQYDGFRTREGQMADVVGAVASGAAEQVPGLDEAVTGLDALINRRSFSESRDQYRNMVEALNEQQRGARNVGGILGFGGTMLLPGIGGANYVSQGLGRGSQIARAMQVGGLGGAVYGGTAAEGGFADRAQGAALGAALGAGTGGAVQGAAPLVGEGFRRLGGGFSEAGSVLSRGVGRVAPEADITPQDTINAQQYVARLLQSSGADLAGSPVAAMGKPITSAEVIGPSGIANMAALARRSGRAGNLTQAQIGARAIEQPNRVVQDFADLTGMDPAGAADAVDNIVSSGRSRVAPMWAEVENLQVSPTPVMNDILRRPSGRAALRRAYRIARDEGVNPETLGLFAMEAGDGGLRTGASAIARDADTLADLDALRAGRGVRGAGQGDSLLQFISKNGGVRDDGGELSTIGADTWNRQGSWRSRAVRENGLSLEQMADRARAAGYFDDVVDATAEGSGNYQRLSSQDMIDAIDAELRGNPRFARAVGDTDRSAAAVMRRDRRAALDERLQREGIDINRASNDEILRRIRDADDADARIMAQLYGEGKDAPQIELVPGEIPSIRTMDYVRRGLNQVLEGKRDKTTRRLVIDDETRPIVENVRLFRDELIRATGGEEGIYARTLAESGDYLRVEEAFRQSDRLFQVGTPQRAFTAATARMGQAERNALVAGFADRLFRDAQAGRLSTRQLNQLNVPVTREKLASLIGAEGADSFMQRVGAEIELARSGGRMAPGTNSVTAEALAAMAEQDGSTGFTADLARNMAQGRGDIMGALALTLGKAAVAPATGFVRGMTVSKPQAVRDEIARLLLLSPEELQAQLTAVAGSARPNADGLAKALRPAAGVGGGQVGAGFVQPDAQNARPANRRAAQ